MAMGMFVARHLGRGGPPLRRVGMVGRFLLTAGRSVQRVMEEHCRAAGDFADRFGLGDDVRTPLLQAFERWDGKGVPGNVGSRQVAPAIRLVHLADNVEAFHHAGGTEVAIAVARERRGTAFDPELVDCFCDHAAAILDGLGELSAWDEVIALDPSLGAPMDEALFDEALAAFGDFADLKDPIAHRPQPQRRLSRRRGRFAARPPPGRGDQHPTSRLATRHRRHRRIQHRVDGTGSVVDRPTRTLSNAPVPDRANALPQPDAAADRAVRRVAP